jgi:putative colanic acid biosynthesis UDP-glucose lipid carrier transferase
MSATSQEKLSRNTARIQELVSRRSAIFSHIRGGRLRRLDRALPALAHVEPAHVELLGVDATSSYLFSRRKRAFDVMASLVILAVLAPLLVMVALIIRLTSPGPVLFRQERTGAGGRPFAVYKFRSMYVADAADGAVVQAARADARITPFGRFMRRTSIDELPQIFNVLQGDMSLIGPRPHAVQHDEYYTGRIAVYEQRFSALPGLSGLAQVNGARGGTPRLGDMERRIAYDLAYIRSASLTGDIRIIGATLREMIFSSSAY